MKVLEKIDKFYVTLTLVLIISAILVVVTAKTIFSSFFTANLIEQSKGNIGLRVDNQAIDKAVKESYEKEVVRLEIR